MLIAQGSAAISLDTVHGTALSQVLRAQRTLSGIPLYGIQTALKLGAVNVRCTCCRAAQWGEDGEDEAEHPQTHDEILRVALGVAVTWTGPNAALPQ